MILDISISIIMLIFGGYVLYEASTYPDYSMLTPVSSDVFPKIMGWTIVICSAAVIARAVWRLNFSPKKEEYRQKDKELLLGIKERFIANRRNLPAAVGIPVLMLLYALLLNSVGFEILSVLFLLISMLLCRERNLWRLILIPILGTAAMYFVFHILLKIQVPLLFLK